MRGLEESMGMLTLERSIFQMLVYTSIGLLHSARDVVRAACTTSAVILQEDPALAHGADLACLDCGRYASMLSVNHDARTHTHPLAIYELTNIKLV